MIPYNDDKRDSRARRASSGERKERRLFLCFSLLARRIVSESEDAAQTGPFLK